MRREVVAELVRDPETLIANSTLLPVLHTRQVKQSAGFPGAAWVRWGSFSVYGFKLHLVCATNRVPVSYELTPANVAEVSLAEELLAGARLGDGVARRLLGDLAYRSAELKAGLAGSGILLARLSLVFFGRRCRVTAVSRCPGWIHFAPGNLPGMASLCATSSLIRP